MLINVVVSNLFILPLLTKSPEPPSRELWHLKVDAKDVNTPDKWVKRLGSGFDSESAEKLGTV